MYSVGSTLWVSSCPILLFADSAFRHLVGDRGQAEGVWFTFTLQEKWVVD